MSTLGTNHYEITSIVLKISMFFSNQLELFHTLTTQSCFTLSKQKLINNDIIRKCTNIELK